MISLLMGWFQIRPRLSSAILWIIGKPCSNFVNAWMTRVNDVLELPQRMVASSLRTA